MFLYDVSCLFNIMKWTLFDNLFLDRGPAFKLISEAGTLNAKSKTLFQYMSLTK